jgi:hypothetical protein
MVSWWLGGFAVLCDWIGSNMDFFTACDTSMPLETYWKLSLGVPHECGDEPRKALNKACTVK